jgi:hypothetical protein
MIQIFINEQELDLPVDIGEQIAINYEAFPLGEFRNTFNNFSGNLNFPPTAKNRLIFGHATNNLAPLTITREYTGRIVSGAIELFFGRVDYERYNNGFECRFVTSGQLLSEEIKQYDMFDVMYGLRRADFETGETWFDHRYLATATQNGIGTNANGDFNVYYPLLDLGYFNNTNKKIGFFDLRASFNLWTMCLAIAKKVNKSLTFSGALPERLQNTFITPKDWKYSDRLIEYNKTSCKVLPFATNFDTYKVEYNSQGFRNFNPLFGVDGVHPIKEGKFTFTTNSLDCITEVITPLSMNFNVNSELTFNCIVNVVYEPIGTPLSSISSALSSRISIGFNLDSTLFDSVDAGISINFINGETVTGQNFATGGDIVLLINPTNGFPSTAEIRPMPIAVGLRYVRVPVTVKFKKSGIFEGTITTPIVSRVSVSTLHTYVDGVWTTVSVEFESATDNPNTPDFILQHDERIYANGLISGADLMGNLKPADVLKYAMRISGSYLDETEETITFIPFAGYDKSEAQDWSGKVNFLQQPIVDYRDNELGKDNWLVYKQDDTNTALDPYYLGGNLPTNLGSAIATLYEAPFAQSAFNQTFNGSASLVRVPYYNAPLAYVYRVWIDDSTNFVKGEYVGYLGRLFKVLNNTTGSAGTPLVNSSNYEEVDYSIFNEQSPEYRAIEVLTDQVTGVEVYNDFGDLQYTNSIVGALNGIDFAQAITDGYGFIPSTFLDYRQVVVQVSLSDLDIHNLDLKKLVFISELNAYFYINKVEEYTPATNVDTTVTLTMLP